MFCVIIVTRPCRSVFCAMQEAKLANDAEKAHEAYKQSLADLNAYQKKFETDMVSLLSRLQVHAFVTTCLKHSFIHLHV